MNNDINSFNKKIIEILAWKHLNNGFNRMIVFVEVDLSFPYRDVHIKRGVDPKECYDLLTEIGRFVALILNITYKKCD